VCFLFRFGQLSAHQSDREPSSQFWDLFSFPANRPGQALNTIYSLHTLELEAANVKTIADPAAKQAAVAALEDLKKRTDMFGNLTAAPAEGIDPSGGDKKKLKQQLDLAWRLKTSTAIISSATG
jgi:hypothetical protein